MIYLYPRLTVTGYIVFGLFAQNGGGDKQPLGPNTDKLNKAKVCDCNNNCNVLLPLGKRLYSYTHVTSSSAKERKGSQYNVRSVASNTHSKAVLPMDI